MPVSFSRLRIAGFKSFAEPAVVHILPGLTGIVGPNGCGKSNVVEALRWAMGESSARSLRGGEMDDVIFAGTAARASRNLAEVTLVLEETKGIAPPPFHEAPELEISRKIERGHGSAYRINGREARARDVQTLFNDLATGAHSSGLVSQGRVGALVSAKPDERRQLLEEAAGITGLHSRRHEAELKLRAAESNLARAEDLRGQLEGQLESLKRQARQANRYRAISGLVRAAEAELLSIQRARVDRVREAARAAATAAAASVAEATAAAAAAAAQAATAAAALPALRSREGEARTGLERHRIAGEQLAAEEARARAALAGAAARLATIEHDLSHAGDQQRDAAAALARLIAEEARLSTEDEAHPPKHAAAEARAAEAEDAVRIAEAEANHATEHAANLSARHRALTDALAQADQRARRLTGQRTALDQEAARLDARRVDPARLAQAQAQQENETDRLAAAQAALSAAEQARAAALAQAAQSRSEGLRQIGAARDAALAQAARARTAALEAAEAQRLSAQAELAAARAAASAAGTTRARLAAEAAALAEVLGVRDGERWPRMVDQLDVPAGLEAALGAVLGEELDSAADEAAARHWRTLPALPATAALPAGAQGLDTLVRAPAALARALSQIGLTEDGTAAQPSLAPGQALVSRDGAVWRWDGYTIKAGTPTAATVRLQQRNRLAALRRDLADATQAADAAAARLATAEQADRTARHSADAATQAARAEAQRAEQAARSQAEQQERTLRAEADAAERTANAAEQQARATRGQAEQALQQATAAARQLAAQAADTEAKLAAVAAQTTRLATEQDEAATLLATARRALADLPDPAAGRAAMEAARARLATLRGQDTAARAERDALARAAAGRAHRRRAIAAEHQDWAMRAQDAAGRVADLAARAEAARQERATLSAAPDEIAARWAEAVDVLDAAEAAHRAIAAALATAESASQTSDRAARAAESALAAARERVLLVQGEAAQADQAWGVVAERIVERLGATPALPDPPAELFADGDGVAAEDKARRKLERLQREREEMGPVNLRAEVEAEEITRQVDLIASERAELTTAIAKLRGSIGHLNREGRERLSAVFAEVDRHFQALFSRMFGGGRAHLGLVGSDDPLEAGLEIYAQPPGKKLSTLSLLSGGEQALTALSLIFAVFRCNPAPVCVLDEVDAPLDDANVERFCLLLDDMVRETGTRFMVVTHHPLTMARMDRLYGVTMQERGVSRLLSVDLQRATQLVDGTVPAMAAE
ncbi:MAG: AAA family ATPase [Acetobacteraceae bacterium]|nr:AAA family ATPase [Acetobacteraceae bacterium]